MSLHCLVLAVGVAVVADPVAADQAPFRESPVGLVPGDPDIGVRMAPETVETWQDQTLAAGGAVVRGVSGQLRQRYALRKVDGQWMIVDAAIPRG